MDPRPPDSARRATTTTSVLWFGPAPLIGDLNWPTEALLADGPLAGRRRRRTGRRTPRAQKIVADRPAPTVRADPRAPRRPSACRELATRYGTPREVAGGDRSNDILKCRLKPLAARGLRAARSDATTSSRGCKKVFPGGVCDWTKPGVGQQPRSRASTYADRKGRVVYGGRRMGPAPRSRALR